MIDQKPVMEIEYLLDKYSILAFGSQQVNRWVWMQTLVWSKQQLKDVLIFTQGVCMKFEKKT